MCWSPIQIHGRVLGLSHEAFGWKNNSQLKGSLQIECDPFYPQLIFFATRQRLQLWNPLCCVSVCSITCPMTGIVLNHQNVIMAD